MLPIGWKQPSSSKPTTSYRIADDHGQDCPGEPHISTPDEALRRSDLRKATMENDAVAHARLIDELGKSGG